MILPFYCQYWERVIPKDRKHKEPIEFGKCGLNMYGGFPSHGVCRRCIDRGENNPDFASQLFARADISHPPNKPRISGCCDPPDKD